MLQKETSKKQCIMAKIVKKSGEEYQQFSFLATTTNYGRLSRKEQSNNNNSISTNKQVKCSTAIMPVGNIFIYSRHDTISVLP
jgi:hypothetical protein